MVIHVDIGFAGPEILLTGCNPGMNGCIGCQTYWCGHRARLEPDRFKVIWYSTTELLSRSWISQSPCVLRRQMVPSPNSVDSNVTAYLPSISLLVARTGNARSVHYSQLMMLGGETCQYRAQSALISYSLACARLRDLSVDHQPSRR